jgi:CRISPR-associated protein Cmr1
MAWTTLRLEVTTPLFNGGAGTLPADTGIRVPSLRGAMRFWFRALAGSVTGPDLKLLADLERTVFGGALGDRGSGSPVQLRIPRQPPLTPARGTHAFLPAPGASRRDREEHVGYWIVYLLGQGLANLRDCTLLRPYVAPGEGLDVKFRFGGDAGPAALALASLWLTCTYGGVGARTHRGFGGLRIVEATGPLPEPWDAVSIRTPGLDHYESLNRLWFAGSDDPISVCMPHVADLVKSRGREAVLDEWPTSPAFPVLSKRHTRAGASGGEPFDNWMQVASHAGEQLRRFRANESAPGAPYWPRLKTAEWTKVVHGSDERFPLGALGLPVNYKGGYVVNAEQHGEPLRRAAPLWLRPVGNGDAWRLLSFAFIGDFLPGPNGPEVRLTGGDRRPRALTITQDDVKRLAEMWIDRLGQDEWRWFNPGDRPVP